MFVGVGRARGGKTVGVGRKKDVIVKRERNRIIAVGVDVIVALDPVRARGTPDNEHDHALRARSLKFSKTSK